MSQLELSPKTRAIICDIDNTICAELDKPIACACRVLSQIDPSVQVHYVTGRPEELRPETERFLEEHGFPDRQNLHLRPMGTWKSPCEHKIEVFERLAGEYSVVVSIGDSEEDEFASRAAGIPFVRICNERTEEVWAEIALLISGLGPEHGERGA